MKKNKQQRYKVFQLASVYSMMLFPLFCLGAFLFFITCKADSETIGFKLIFCSIPLLSALIGFSYCAIFFQYVEFGETELILRHRIFGTMKKIPYQDMEIESLKVLSILDNPMFMPCGENDYIICIYNRKKNRKRFVEAGMNLIGKDRFHVIYTPEFYQKLKEVLEKQGYPETLPERPIFKEPKHEKWFAYYEIYYVYNFGMAVIFAIVLSSFSYPLITSTLSGTNVTIVFFFGALVPLLLLHSSYAFLFYQRLYFEKDRLVIKLLLIGKYRTMPYENMTIRVQSLKGMAYMYRFTAPLYICIYDKTKKTKPFKRLGFNFSKRRLHLYYTKEVYDMLMEDSYNNVVTF